VKTAEKNFITNFIKIYVYNALLFHIICHSNSSFCIVTSNFCNLSSKNGIGWIFN